jgi:hypothetical protein
MSKGSRVSRDQDLASEYPLAEMKGGVRGKYAARLADAVVVRLDPDVAAVFTTDVAVNETLRAAMQGGKLARTRRPKPTSPVTKRRRD